jgi:AbrB family looped-hinge helix DNA binding protein
MTYKVGPKGQVVLPKTIRDRFGIHPGDEVIVENGDDHIEIRKAASIESLMGIFKDGPDMLADLEREHREEIEREERKVARRST